MGLTAEFNTSYSASRSNEYVLCVSTGSGYYYYDFVGRMMMTVCHIGHVNMTTTPFSQIDRETLVLMRDKLIELKGNPPELPGPSAAGTPTNKLNL